jgi:predicted house-cleaning noncanonical NTP pyrophosphatase (MazG superfamily)
MDSGQKQDKLLSTIVEVLQSQGSESLKELLELVFNAPIANF